MSAGAFPAFTARCNIGVLLYLLFVCSSDKSALLPDTGSIFVCVDRNAALGEMDDDPFGVCDYYSSGFKPYASQ